jgi:predicted transcriptional regulator
MSRRPSRIGRHQVSGHFPPDVLDAISRLAKERNVTHQVILAEALNDLFEKNGLQRLARQTALPRGRATVRRHATGPDAAD